MQHLLWVELLLAVLTFLLLLWRPSILRPVENRLVRPFVRFAEQPVRSVAVVGILAFLFAAGLSSLRWPEPRIFDEFSYLLAADTFANGRLTNPTHPMWEHFDSPHVLQQPTYQSKYPPGQGGFLALGQVLASEPAVGVWLSWALACAALCWMLRAWLPPGWALLGAMIAAVHFGVFDDWGRGRFCYWSQSYWGGAVAMLGGALVFGALRRLVANPRIRLSLVLSAGLLLLANTRPYEGFVAALPAALVLLAQPFLSGKSDWKTWGLRVAAPLLGALALGGAWMGYYHYRVTGDPLLMPHMEYDRQHGGTPHLVWEQGEDKTDPGPEEETRAERREQDLEEAKTKRLQRYFQVEYKRRYRWLWTFYFGPALSVGLLALVGALRDRWVLFALVTCAGVALANVFVIAGFPHYFAPVAPLLVLLPLSGFLRLADWNRAGRPLGRLLSSSLVAAVVATSLAAVGTHAYFSKVPVYAKRWSHDRAAILSRLEEKAGKHLVIVRYSPTHYKKNEWVYNGADIDGGKVVWVRALDSLRRSQLLLSFKDRTVWEVKADRKPPRLQKASLRRAR